MSFFLRLRNIIKGYNLLKKSKKLSTLNDIKSQFILSDHKVNFKYLFIDYEVDNFNDLINQYLALKLRKIFISKSARFNGITEEVLFFFGTKKHLVFPLPKIWISILTQNKINTSRFFSSFYWYIFIVLSFVQGLIYILDTFFTFFPKKIFSKEVFSKSFFFDSLSDSQFPDTTSVFKSHDVFSWFSKFYDPKLSTYSIMHNNKRHENFSSEEFNINYSDYIIPPINGFRDLVIFSSWSFYIIFYTFFQMCCSKWWYPLMLVEIIKTKRFGLTNSKKFIADEYFFYNDWLYRPLWTYFIEKNFSSKILFYFYSTNSEGFKTNFGYKEHDFDWRTISWPYYLVWDNYQKDFIKKHAKRNPFFLVLGPVYFLSKIKDIQLFSIKKFTLVIFDVPPVRDSEYCKLGLSHNYYCLNNSIKFLNDILFCSDLLSINVIFKRKRKAKHKYHDIRYQRYCEQLINDNKIVEIDSLVSPFHLISNSDLSISFPYTSTGIIGKFLDRPSCYYDCTSTLFKDDVGNHGVALISSKEELMQWLKISLNI